jgi:O-antigen/teichoic acid export membrane protein
LYSAGLRIVYLVYIIPGIIASSIFPQLAKSQQNKERLSTILNRAFNILLFLAVPMTIGGVILAKKIILVLFGSQYEAGVLSFALLCLTYVPVFLIASFGNAIFAINQEKKLFGYALLGVFGNLILDIIFIPIWGIAGSALATVINQTIGILYLTFLTKKYIPLKTDIKNLFKILAGSLIMGVFVWMSLIAKANLFVSIFVGVVSYLAVLFALKEKEFLEGLALIKNFFAPKAKN